MSNRRGASSRPFFITATFLICLAVQPLSAQSTNISIGNTAIQPSVNRMGMNLGQIFPYGSEQLYKNLFAYNPGFNNTLYQSVIYCSTGSTSRLCMGGTYAYFGAGFWATDGSASVRVLTGAATGCTTTLSSWTNTQYGFSTPCNISSGDYIAIKKVVTPGSVGFSPTYGWNASGSTAAVFGISSDAPPASKGTTYTQSLQITAPSSTDYATLSAFADNDYLPWTGDTKSFVDLNGTYSVSFWAKSVSGASPQISVTFNRGGTYFLNAVQDKLTNTWTQYTHTFSAAEVGQQSNSLYLQFAITGAESVLLDKVNVSEAQTSGNPTVFRDVVVSTLQTLKPGVLRMSDLEGLTNTFSNLMTDQWGRMPVGFSTVPVNGTPGYYNPITYSIPEFLQLCQTVGADAWLTIPVTLSPADASELIDYLSAPAVPANGVVSPGAALRVAQGFTAPWTSVIGKIHLELGNEEWNGGTFEGGSMEFNFTTTYGAYAQSIFAAMKANPNYVSSATSLVLDGQFVNSYLIQYVQDSCNNNDEIDVAPYTGGLLINSDTLAQIWQPSLAESQVYWQPGAASGPNMVCGEYVFGVLCPSEGYFSVGGAVATVYYGGGMYLDKLAEANSTHPVAISIYEENNSGTQGDFTQSQLNSHDSAWGAGLEQASEFLTNLQNGIITQNFYKFAGYNSQTSPNPNSGGATYTYLWGSVVDLGGPTNLRRPQFLAEQLINSGITPGAAMLGTTQTGTPTFAVGNPAAYPAADSVLNTVSTSGVNTIQSFAFNNGSGNYSLILLNLDIASSHAVTFSGVNAPSGTVNLTTLTSQNLGDTNEVSAIVVPTTSTLSNPTGLTLTPYTMCVLTWNSTSHPPAITNVSVSSITTTSATITWTTDQASTSVVNYGATTAYGSSSPASSALTTTHSVALTGLAPGTVYDFDVVSANAANSSTASANSSFTTTPASAPSGPAPKIGYLAYWGITSSGITLSWSTDLPATTQLAYGTTTAVSQLTPLQSALTNSHGVVLTGLTSGTTYYFVALATSGAGVTGNSTMYSFVTGGTSTTTAPVISAVSATGLTSNSATIAWTTDQATSSLVNYGASTAYGLTSLNATLVTSHSVPLTNLSPGTKYNFDVVSTNATNNTATSTNYTFSTPASSVPPPSISYVSSWGITLTGATVTWSTNTPATTQLAWGTTTALGQLSPLQTTLASSHGVTLTGLTSGTTYYFVAQSSAGGVTGYSTVYSFTTGH